MREAPYQVAPTGIAGKQARAWNEHVECQCAAGGQVPGYGSQAVSDVVAVLQVKERAARDQNEVEPVIQTETSHVHLKEADMHAFLRRL